MHAAVHLILRDADPNGIVVATRDNWTGKALSLPVSDLLLVKDLLQTAGVYVLTGIAEDDEESPRVYVGEAEDVQERLKTSHAQLASNTVTWQRVTVFVSQGQDLHKAHVRWLEAALIERALQVKRVKLTNGNGPAKPKLPEFDQVFVEAFLTNMLVLYPLLGVTAFAAHGTAHTPSQGTGALVGAQDGTVNITLEEFQLRRAGEVVATGVVTAAGGITVRSGAKIVESPLPSMKNTTKRVREKLADLGAVSSEQGVLVLLQDYDFTSPSTAASAILGYEVNGRKEWRTVDGERLGDLQEKVASAQLKTKIEDDLP